ncbi:MAG: hypothetical protein UIH27_18075 [Ruminococcus sp.]|nr:hypothetical protein [Ruminococcus sp.]
MKILESRPVCVKGNVKIQFLRIDPEDIGVTLSEIMETIMDLSWLKRFNEDFTINSFKRRAEITIKDIQSKFDSCDNGSLTKDAGEYVVSELAREAIVNQLGYLDIPLAELIGKKTSGNPGFDFHSQNLVSDIVIFGEAKYLSKSSAYSSAITQIKEFIDNEKDIADIADLRDFCSANALSNANKGIKGFAAAFSAKRTSSDNIIKSITNKDDFKKLIKYKEIILVAVNL